MSEYEKMSNARRVYIERGVPASVQKEIAEGLLADNIVDHLEKKKKMEDVEKKFWRYNPLWRSIEDHLMNATECVLINRKTTIPCYNAYPGVYLKAVYKLALESMLCFRVEVDYKVDFDEDDYYGPDKTVDHIYVPIELAVEWNEEKWNEFLIEKKKDKDEKNKKKDMRKLSELLRKYPKVASEVLLSANLSQIPTRLQVKGEEKFVKK